MLSLNNYSIIDWISITIDAHINLFIVNPNEDVVGLIEAIDDQINRLCYVCQHLGPIKTLFEMILAKQSRKHININLPAPKRGEYCIELLKF